MAKLLIHSIKVEAELDNPAQPYTQYFDCGIKRIEGVVELSFQSSGSFNDFLKEDGSLDRELFFKRVLSALQKADINFTMDI